MNSLANQFDHDFKNGDFRIFGKNNNEIYYENVNGFWLKREFDESGNEIHFETSYGFWSKREYDDQNNEIYYENSNGLIIDSRPKKIITINGKKYQEI